VTSRLGELTVPSPVQVRSNGTPKWMPSKLLVKARVWAMVGAINAQVARKMRLRKIMMNDNDEVKTVRQQSGY